MNNKGSVKGLFTLAILVAAAFLIVSFGRPYYHYYALRSFTNNEVLMDVGEVGRIRRNVLKRAAELGISLDDLQVTKGPKEVTVTAHWSEVVDLWGYYSKTFYFHIKESD